MPRMADWQSMGNLEGIVLSEPGEPNTPLSLDVVRARIFYLASDVEPVSPPAAMLLRAVADAIEEGDSSDEQLNEPANSNGALAAMLSQASAIHTLGFHGRAAAPASERRLGVVSSQAGHKR
jgi:hypothetical protein